MGWRRLIFPGLPSDRAEAAIRDVLDVADTDVEGPVGRPLLWGEEDVVTWQHLTLEYQGAGDPWVRSADEEFLCYMPSIPVTVMEQTRTGNWRDYCVLPELALRLSRRSGGWVVAGESDSHCGTWGLLVCHDGQVVTWRQDAVHAPGRPRDRDLSLRFGDIWGTTVRGLLGCWPSQLIMAAEEIPYRFFRLGDPPGRWAPDPESIGPAAWQLLCGPPPEGLFAQSSRLRIIRLPMLTDPVPIYVPELSPPPEQQLAVIRGESPIPDPELLAMVRHVDSDAVLLTEPADPQRAAPVAARLNLAPGVFVAPDHWP